MTDEKGEVTGGIDGCSFHGEFSISNFWIKAAYRKQGWGKKLLEEAEQLAKRRGCFFITLATFDFFNVLPFYQKFGYQIEWESEGYENDAKRFYLKKKI